MLNHAEHCLLVSYDQRKLDLVVLSVLSFHPRFLLPCFSHIGGHFIRFLSLPRFGPSLQRPGPHGLPANVGKYPFTMLGVEVRADFGAPFFFFFRKITRAPERSKPTALKRFVWWLVLQWRFNNLHLQFSIFIWWYVVRCNKKSDSIGKKCWSKVNYTTYYLVLMYVDGGPGDYSKTHN